MDSSELTTFDRCPLCGGQMEKTKCTLCGAKKVRNVGFLYPAEVKVAQRLVQIIVVVVMMTFFAYKVVVYLFNQKLAELISLTP